MEAAEVGEKRKEEEEKKKQRERGEGKSQIEKKILREKRCGGESRKKEKKR